VAATISMLSDLIAQEYAHDQKTVHSNLITHW